MENFLISVIILTHNRKEALINALKSVYSQTYKKLEVIIIDDCSDYNLESILKENFKNYVYLRNHNRMGVSFSRNRGLKAANGDYITFLDDDDIWEKDKLELQLQTALVLKKDVFLFCNDFSVRDKKYGWDRSIKSGFINFKKDKFYLTISFTPPSCWFLSRNIISSIGYFDENLTVYEDLDYLVRILEKYPAYYLDKVLVKSGFCLNHLSSLSMDNIKSRVSFLKKHFCKIKRDKNYMFRFYYNLGKDYLRLKVKKDARKFFLKAFILKPYKIELLFKFLKTFI